MSNAALAVMGLYLLVTIAIGAYAHRHTGASPHEYFLAGGTLGRVVFPLTMFATLMSSFLFLGSAGYGYQHGLAWLAMIGVEAVGALALGLIGVRAWRRANAAGYITPTEFLGDAFDSDRVKLLTVVVQFAWAIPYVAIQAMGGGILFETISGGAVPFWAGGLIVVTTTAIYLSLGGLRGVAWSDALQGVALVVLLGAAGVYVLPEIDPAALADRLASESGYLTTAGELGFFTPRVWFSFALMNAMAIVAYPQMFQRFFAAKDERSFRALLVWWPVMAIVAAVVPATMGVWGTELLPGLSDPDSVIPALLQTYAPAAVVGVVMGGALAAMMSTADSLVLTLSSLVTRDVYHDHIASTPNERRELWVTRTTILVLLAAGYVLGLAAAGQLPGVTAVGSIIDLAVYFVQGNALLLPVFLAALYWPRGTATGALAAIVGGQGYFLAATFAGAPSFGFMPFVPALAVACAGLVAGTHLTSAAPSLTPDPDA